jgi:hypothetical protein
MNESEHQGDRSWTAVTYPQDFSEEGASLGPQTILRLQKIVSVQRQGGFRVSDIVLACGMCPTPEYPRQTRSFGIMMKKWLIAEGTFTADAIHSSPNYRVWNCIQSTLEMIRMIEARDLPRNVLVVSTGFHIYPRMWMTWKILLGCNRRWKLAFAPAWNGTFGLFHELGGTIKYIPMALWYRIFGAYH